MLAVEYIEELLGIMFEGIQDKKEYLDTVCEKYMTMDNRDDIYSEFVTIIGDISAIFDVDSLPILFQRLMLLLKMCTNVL